MSSNDDDSSSSLCHRNLVTFILLVAVSLVSAAQDIPWLLRAHVARAAPRTNLRHTRPIPPSRAVYFDIGANNGKSITDFLAHRFDLLWDVVLLEASPVHTARLRALCADIVRSGRARSCLPLVGTALTTYDGTVTFSFNEVVEGEARPDTELTGQGSLATGSNLPGGTATTTKALDVVTLFRSVFPLRSDDHVVVKMGAVQTRRARPTPPR